MTDVPDPSRPAHLGGPADAAHPADRTDAADAAAEGAPVHPSYPVRTKRLSLRPVRRDDLEAIHAHRSLPEVALYLPHEPHTREATARTIERALDQEALAHPGDWLDLAVEDESGRVVGEVLLRREPDEPATGQVGFAFHPDVHGTGIATEAVSGALDIAFEAFGWRRVTGICDIRNLASAALMRRIGMRHESVLRDGTFLKNAWCSDSVFAVLAHEWRRTPPRSADERAVDTAVGAFLSAFTRRSGGAVTLDAARAVLSPDAVIEYVATDGQVTRMDVDEFLVPRQEYLNGTELTDFEEFEVQFSAVVGADRALRSSLYYKHGIREGTPFRAWGRKHTRLTRTATGDWLIDSITWADDPEVRG
ncbi:GNAT family N-acetyltransferase [Streptomyces sp. Je 1-79]|uniref:GNAT family N-acetyltransferase n=1 Tax=Streptomyces sp. Je 1-79 TaxID=2943847 RepID=UPI0021A6816A|nr:GNAT family N-acetyltransferase [Streptomyces sp. Je 1-79]MCT4357116.1 GNAT family N-acetyltransferase [Streptomyces sp. Je 1-79]